LLCRYFRYFPYNWQQYFTLYDALDCMQPPCGQAIGNIPKVHILPECFYPKKVLPLRLYSPRDVTFIKGEFLLLPDKFRLFDAFQSMK
ncbi:MAG: hypothetical protein ACK559_07180, partial [bacterium]